MVRKSLFAVPLALGFTFYAATRIVPGPRADGTTVLPSGWRIRPAGRQVAVGTLPLGLAVAGDGGLWVTNNGYAANGLMRIDPARAEVTDTLRLSAAWLGLVATPRGDTVWAAGGATNRVYRFTRRTVGWTRDSAILADSGKALFAAGLTLFDHGRRLAVVGNLSDSLYLLDAATLTRTGAVAVGHRPYTVIADSATLYVSNWGDSSVSAIAVNAPETSRTIFVGPHPSALVLRGAELFAALAGSNAVSRLDLRTGQVREQLNVALRRTAPVGSDPGGLALAPDGRTLYVALAGNNAVAQVRVSPQAPLRVTGLIPAGWYPTAVAVSADGRTLFVANGKGAGSGANPTGRYIGNVITGSVSIVPVPDSGALARYTARAYAMSPYTNAALRAGGPGDATTFPPQLRHVVYIIRENRTYDQVLGDVARGNGDPSLTIFGDPVTPNAHALAARWVLFDNFYVDGEVSADGHQWSTAAFANDYTEKTWPAIYSDRRDWDLANGEDLADRAEAYLWDAAKHKGLWVVNFGEMTTDEPDTIRTNIAGLKGITADHYPGFVMSIPDTVRARLFADSVTSWDRQNKFPDLVILYLPRDHTVGRQADRPTPRAMVADNDLALGRVIERLSHSRAWPGLAVFAVEDDAQNGPDHVDAHRSVLLAASAYARRGAVDSTFYTTSSVVRSIGLILGLPPRSQYDAGARPLWSAFTRRADLTPFVSLPARWPMDELNPHAFRSRVPDRDLARPDAADENELNREIWESVRPGERMPAPRRAFPLGY